MTKYEGTDVVDIATSPEDADILYVIDDSNAIFKTVNAGSAFTELPAPAGITMLTSIAIGVVDGDTFLFVGDSDGLGGGEAYSLAESQYGSTWQDMGLDDDVIEIATSPEFSDEANPQVIAVVSDGTDTWVAYKYGSGNWGAEEANAPLDAIPAGSFEAEAAQIAFPDDYSSDSDSGEMEFFIAVVDDTDGGGVYRIIVSSDFNAFDDANAVSVDVAGNVGDVSALCGTDGGAVYRSTDGTGGTWTEDKKGPTGDGDVYVLLTDDYLESETAWALANSTTDGLQALSQTTDGGVVFTDISLIDADKTGVNALSLGSKFVATDNAALGDDLWREEDGTWERVEHAAAIDLVAMSPDEDAVFWADMTGKEIYRSTDGGSRFINQLTDPTNLYGWLIIDKNTIIAGGTGEIYKSTNNGTTWSKKTSGLGGTGNLVSFAMSPDFDNDETILAGSDDTEVYLSDDGGGSWDDMDSGDLTNTGDDPTHVVFDVDYVDNMTFYVATDKYVERYDDDEEWDVILNDGADGIAAFTQASGIAMGSDGTLYVSCDGGTGMSGMARSLNPTGSTIAKCEWEQVNDNIGGEQLFGLQVTEGSNLIWGLEDGGANVWTYLDTLTGSPSLTSPGNAGSSNRVDSATLTWSEIDGADEYQIKVNTRDDFNGSDYSPSNVEVTSVTISGLSDGTTYYWKVRVAEGEPTLSRYSSVRSFTTTHGAAQWNPFTGGVPETPTNGATNVSLMPTFAWNPADWATGYEWELADNQNFSGATKKTLPTTAYALDTELDYSTTYYWRVRATSATSSSEWAVGVFTTMGKAAPPPAPPPAPPAPPPETIILPSPIPPFILWTIVGVGAALVIAVIILIVRTRRAV
jgi:hypothetical protein